MNLSFNLEYLKKERDASLLKCLFLYAPNTRLAVAWVGSISCVVGFKSTLRKKLENFGQVYSSKILQNPECLSYCRRILNHTDDRVRGRWVIRRPDMKSLIKYAG